MQSFAGVGINSQVAKVKAILEKLATLNVEVDIPLSNYKYGASMEPDEDELKTTSVRYVTLRDPDGYLIEIHEPVQPEFVEVKKGKSTGSKKKSKSISTADAPVAATEMATESSPASGKPPAAAAKIILHVEDLDESVEFYTKGLGMKLLRRRSNVNNTPKEAAMVAYVVCITQYRRQLHSHIRNSNGLLL